MKIDGVNINTFPISQVNIKGLVKKIYATPFPFSICPFCKKALRDYTYAVQVSSKECVKLYGSVCHECDAFFSNAPKLIKLIDKKHFSESACQFCYDFDVPYNVAHYASIFSRLQTGFCQITVCAPGKIQTYTIVTSKQDADSSKYIFHYTEHIALELLTAITLGDKNIRVDTDNFTIEKIRMANTKYENDVFHILRSSSCVEVIIKKNGGYYSFDEDVVQVHGLVFCENSRRLEIMPMSYSKEFDIYYVDSQVYSRFREACGYPIVKYVTHSKGDWAELREESLLHCLGYNVGSANGLSDAARHKMLANFVDLGFIEVHTIVKLLTRLINLNRNRTTRKGACEKWESDLDFIKSYKFDPNRFAFVSKVRRL